MTAQQIRWAAQHSWFVTAVPGGCIVSEMIYCTESELYGERTLEFTDFDELREWAGY